MNEGDLIAENIGAIRWNRKPKSGATKSGNTCKSYRLRRDR